MKRTICNYRTLIIWLILLSFIVFAVDSSPILNELESGHPSKANTNTTINSNSSTEAHQSSNDHHDKEDDHHGPPPPSYQLDLHSYSYKPQGFRLYARQKGIGKHVVGFKYTAANAYDRYVIRVRFHGYPEYATQKLKVKNRTHN